MRYITITLAAITLALTAAFSPAKKLTITSVFAHHGMIPLKYSCLGQEVSPPLNIDGIPPEAKSLAVIMYDVEAERKVKELKPASVTKAKKGKRPITKPAHTETKTICGYTHWVAWNIDVTKSIPENFKNQDEGMNDNEQRGYKGVCPTTGKHNYHFMVYALDTKLNLPKDSGKAALEKLMEGHIVAKGELVGWFDKAYK